MQKGKNINSKVSLVFSRWSRKNFSSFCSIGRNVIIARVKNQIADASLSKNIILNEENISESSVSLYSQIKDQSICLPDSSILDFLEITGLISFIQIKKTIVTPVFFVSELYLYISHKHQYPLYNRI